MMHIRTLPLLLLTGLLMAAAPSSDQGTKRELRSPSALRILVVADMEGLSGVNDGRMFSTAPRDSAFYAKGLDRLHADLNATIAGLFDAGVSDVVVADTHASGANIRPRDLDRRARLLPHDTVGDAYFDLAKPGRYDAVVAVGMHDKPLSGGFSPHTLGAGLSPVINGHTLTETELVAYEFGMIDVPVIFVSGDDHLQHDLEGPMPWLQFVVVKRARGVDVADLLPAEEVSAALRAGARRAVQALAQMKALKLTAPARAGLLATYPMSLPNATSHFARLPGAEVRGDTATFPARDYAEAYSRIRFLVGFAVLRKDQSVLRMVASKPDGAKLVQQANDSVFGLWPAYEAAARRP